MFRPSRVNVDVAVITGQFQFNPVRYQSYRYIDERKSLNFWLHVFKLKAIQWRVCIVIMQGNKMVIVYFAVL